MGAVSDRDATAEDRIAVRDRSYGRDILQEQQARGEAYLAANRFTVADLCVASVAAWVRPAAALLAAYPLTQAWLGSCLERPAQKQSRTLGA